MLTIRGTSPQRSAARPISTLFLLPVDFGLSYVVFAGPDDTNDAVFTPQEHLHLTSELSFCLTFDDNLSAVVH